MFKHSVLLLVAFVSMFGFIRNAFAGDPPPYILRWGSQGSGESQFTHPLGLTSDGVGNIYVADRAQKKVKKFSSSGGYITQWSPSDPNMLVKALAVDSNQRIYSVGGSNRVEVFSTTGVFQNAWTVTGASELHDIAVGPDGNIYLSDYGQILVGGRILKYSPSGEYLSTIAGPGFSDGEVYQPTSLTVDPDGNIYVLSGDGGTSPIRIQKYDSQGAYLARWTEGFPEPYGFPGTSTIGGIDNNGNVLTLVNSQNKVRVYSPSGQIISEWGSTGTGNGQFQSITDVIGDGSGNVYVLDLGTYSVQKFGPGSGLRPVVMLHGYCDDGNMWVELGNYLTARGFSPHAISMEPNNARPTTLAAKLAQYLDETFPNQEVDIIAHSMGGLVARQYIRQRKENSRIRTLITLGTPHHGVDLMTYALKNKGLSWVIREVFGLCHLEGAAMPDLATGSIFLNKLNYNTAKEVDPWLGRSAGSHPPEVVYDSTLIVWNIAGTKEFSPVLWRATKSAWVSGSVWSFPTYQQNDGVVGEDAAVMWGNLDNARIDTDMGIVPLQHTSSPWLYDGTRSFQNATDLFPHLENVLRGVSLPGSPPQQNNAMFASTKAESDTVMTVLLSEDGSLTAAQVFEQSVTLPVTAYAQFTMAADSALFRLRKPDGTLLSPGDTLTMIDLHYAEDRTLGFGIYGIDNPTPGTWKAVFDASANVTAQNYAVGAEAAVKLSVNLEFINNSITNPVRTVRASLEDAGVPQTGVTWTMTVMKPDSTTFTIDVYDDGAHQDLLANDGVYGATFNLPGLLGFYQISAKAVLTMDSTSYVETTLTELNEFKDLAIDSTLGFSRNSIPAGDSLIVSGTVRNLGVTAVSDVVVELWDNHVKLATQMLSLGGGQSNNVSFLWRSAAPDTHLIELVVNPFVVPDEVEISNNTASRQIVLGQPIVGVGANQGTPSLHLGPVVPSPFMGSTAIHFTMSSPGRATLSAYDVAGRRLKHWDWETLPAGPRVVTWDGRSDNGAKTAAGVVFLRLNVNGVVLTTKMILLK